MVGKTIGMVIIFLLALFVIGWGGVKVWHLIRRETDDERRLRREETEEFRDAGHAYQDRGADRQRQARRI